MSRTEALHYDPREGSFQTHSGEPHLRGKEGLVFTGQGGEADVAKEEIASFFRMIDAAVCDFLHAQTEPLVFAGVDYLFPIYREHNHYPHLLPKHISGNPDLLSPLELSESAWPLVEASLRQRQEAEIAKYWNLVGQGRGSNRIEEIVTAAHAVLVETLFICPAVRRLGAFDPHTYDVRLDDHPRNDSEDLVNLAVCFVLKHRGKVEAIGVRQHSRRRLHGGGISISACRSAWITLDWSRRVQMNLTHFLDQQDITYQVYRHHETYDAQHMAQTLHVPGRKIAKTVMARASGGSTLIVLVVPGTKFVDLRRVSAVLGGIDVRLATESEILERCPGCEFGVVPIFGSQYGMETIVDESVAKQERIVFQGDTHEEAIQLRFSDFYVLEHPRIATIIQSHPKADLVS